MIAGHEPLSEKLRRILIHEGPESFTLNELIRRTEGRGVFLIIILLSLPFVTPIALAGLSNILGWIMMLMAIRLARSLPPRLPAFIGERALPSAHLTKIASGSGGLTRIELARGRAPTVGTVSTGGRQLAALAPLGGSMLAGWDAASGSLRTLDDQGRERHSLPLSQVYGDQAPFLLASGDDLAMVGAEANDTRARIDQAFAERAPAAGKAEVNAIAEEESQVRFGGPPRGSVQIAEAQSALRELKRGWLTRSLGLQKVDELLRAPAATRVTVVRGLSTAKPEPLAEDRIEGFTPQTGFQQCEHVLPVFWSDPRQASPTLLVGLNAAPRELPPGGAAALVRAYSLPAR